MTLRDVSIRFFKLKLSQKLAITKRLNLTYERDLKQTDFEYFRDVCLAAQEQGLIKELDREISEVTND